MSQTKAQLIDPVDLSIVTADLADDAVTAAKLASNAVVNASVDASAAIAGTKISPDFGSQNITTTGITTTSKVTLNSTSPMVEFEESDGNPDYRIISEGGELLFQDADAGPATRIKINTDGHIDIAGNLDVGAGIDVTGAITGTAGLSVEGATVFNDAGADVDFRIEGVSDANLFHVDASANRIGISTNDPSAVVSIKGNGGLLTLIKDSDSNNNGIIFQDSSKNNHAALWHYGSDDAMVFWTGGSTERMRIDSSGRLLIGTTSARAIANITCKTQIEATDGTAALSITRNDNAAAASTSRLNFGRSRATSLGGVTAVTTNDILGEIRFSGADGTDLTNHAASIGAVVDGSVSSNTVPGRLVFSTATGSDPLERMRIDSDGDVLVGLTTALSTQAGSIQAAGPIIAKSYINAHTSNAAVLQYISNKSVIRAYGASSGTGILQFNVGGGGGATDSEAMRIDSSGRLLIGTTVTTSNQSGRLNVFGTTGDDAYFSIRRGSNNGSGPRFAMCKSRNTTDGSFSGGTVQNGDILGTIHFYANDSQGFEEGAAIAAVIDGTPGSNDVPTRLTFSTTPDGSDTKVERMRIDNDGKVGIGNTGPTNTFDGAGLKIEKYQHRNTSYASPDGYYGASLGEVTNSATKVWATVESHYAQANAVSAGIFLKAFHQDAGGSQCGFTIKNLKDQNDLTFSRVSTAASTGNPAVELERLRIRHQGGITFNGDTAAANALDDYEEGTWVPDIFNAGSTSNWTAKDGNYQKVGNTVTVWFRCDGGTQPRSGASGGHLTITNLPFTLNGMDANTVLGIGAANFISSGSEDCNISTAGSGNPFVRQGGGNEAEQCNYFSAVFTYLTTQ